MKQLKLSLALLLVSFFAFSQAPNIINYQGVALNAGGTPIANQTISIRASIHDATANGTVVFSEDRTVTTDASGLFDLQIGSPGSVNNFGTINNVAWHSSLKFLRIKMDPAGGVNYTDMGTQQLASVPYALNAKSSSSLTPDATVNLTNISNGGANTNQVLQYNGSSWAPANVTLTPFSLPFTGTDASANSFVVNNTNSNGYAIRGNSTGIGGGVFGNATGSTGAGLYGSATGSGGHGVYAYANSTTGKAVTAVHGGTNGIALDATSNTGSAIVGTSISGIGVKAKSTTGMALEVDGNLKISGGNTNPSDGAVLTSDANGNARWEDTKIGFMASYNNNTNLYLNGGTFSIIPLFDSYDASNSFNNTNAASDPNTFIAPVSGLYSFSCYVAIYGGIIYDFTYMGAALYINGTSSFTHRSYGLTDAEEASVDFNQKIHLNAGDKVTLKVRHDKTFNTNSLLIGTEFSGVLVFAD